MASPPIMNISDLDAYLVRKYITACHILHFHELVDAYGHISVRLSPTTFLMSRYLAPALVAAPADLVIYSIDNAEPLIPNPPRGCSIPSISSSAHLHLSPRHPPSNLSCQA
jgi:hypothetical protein